MNLRDRVKINAKLLRYLYILNFAVVFTGAIYAATQLALLGEVKDTIFIVLLVIASVILSFGLYYLRLYVDKRLPGFLEDSAEGCHNVKQEAEDIRNNIFSKKWIIYGGLVYGLIVAAGPTTIGAWPDAKMPRLSLSVFLFTVNVITGAGTACFISFLITVPRLANHIKIRLWQFDSESVGSFLGISRRVALLSALYVGISLSSIMLSVFPISNHLIIEYSVFCAICLVVALAYPAVPLRRKMGLEKRRAISSLCERLQSDYEMRFDKPEEFSAEDFEATFQLLERIRQIKIWPFTVQSILSLLSVILLACAPVIFQIFLEKVFS